MKLHLNYKIPHSEFEIDHQKNIFLIGSCFSENMGDQLKSYKFHTESNPSGILFNPFSIATALENYLHEEKTNNNTIIEKSGEYFSFLHHSAIKSNSEQELIEQLNRINSSAKNNLKKADFLIITFGTAFYYYHQQLKACVANCHKQASDIFEKRMSTVEEIVNQFNSIIKQLHQLNPQLKMIFTVSPVKYLKDGLIENNLSKSTLLLSVNQLLKNNNCFYFPAFELINDDLRDYRFYKEDMGHPNEQAIKYIWVKFSETYFNNKTIALNDKIEKLHLALSHKQMHNHHEEQLKFQNHIHSLREEIRNSEPSLNI